MGLDSIAFPLLRGNGLAQGAKDIIMGQLCCYEAIRVMGDVYDAQKRSVILYLYILYFLTLYSKNNV